MIPEAGLDLLDWTDDLSEALLLLDQTLSLVRVLPEVRGLQVGVEFLDAQDVGGDAKATPR